MSAPQRTILFIRSMRSLDRVKTAFWAVYSEALMDEKPAKINQLATMRWSKTFSGRKLQLRSSFLEPNFASGSRSQHY
jgi:hypothetical protein